MGTTETATTGFPIWTRSGIDGVRFPVRCLIQAGEVVRYRLSRELLPFKVFPAAPSSPIYLLYLGHSQFRSCPIELKQELLSLAVPCTRTSSSLSNAFVYGSIFFFPPEVPKPSRRLLHHHRYQKSPFHPAPAVTLPTQYMTHQVAGFIPGIVNHKQAGPPCWTSAQSCTDYWAMSAASPPLVDREHLDIFDICIKYCGIYSTNTSLASCPLWDSFAGTPATHATAMHHTLSLTTAMSLPLGATVSS